MRNGTVPRLATARTVASVLLVACGGDPTALDRAPTTGAIQVAVAMTGVDLPPTYTVSVSGRRTSANQGAAATLSGLQPGVHNVSLLELPWNCLVAGFNPAPVTVVAGETAAVTFSVTCAAATGGLRVTTLTTGVDVDPAGYVVQVDASTAFGSHYRERTSIAVAGTLTVAGVPAGRVTVTLDNLPLNCGVAGTNPRIVSVAAAETLALTFDVSCTAATDQLAYVSALADGPGDIYLINANGTGRRRLTLDPSAETDPAWSPDGKRIAFTTDRDGNAEIYVMDAEGSSVVRLTNDARADYQPAWSPDGGRIVFVSERDGNPDIYVMNADGSNVLRLTNHGNRDTEPAWSPDGGRIAFTSERDGVAQVYVMNANGSAPARYTTEGGKQPAWAPDGTRIAYTSQACGWYSYYCAPAIFLKSATGNPELLSNALGDAPTWSPDGRKIAYDGVTCDYYFYRCDRVGIRIARLDGATVVGEARGYNPAWRP